MNQLANGVQRIVRQSPIGFVPKRSKRSDAYIEGSFRYNPNVDPPASIQDIVRAVQMQQTTVYDLLVVNVGGLDYEAPSNTLQLIDDWFLDSASLATQMADCSRNRMEFRPRRGPFLVHGVITIELQQKVCWIRGPYHLMERRINVKYQ